MDDGVSGGSGCAISPDERGVGARDTGGIAAGLSEEDLEPVRIGRAKKTRHEEAARAALFDACFAADAGIFSTSLCLLNSRVLSGT